MSEKSPNSLKSPDVKVEKMRKWPMYVGGFALLVLFGVLFYSVNFGNSPRKKDDGKKETGSGSQTLVDSQGKGLLTEDRSLNITTPPRGGISGLPKSLPNSVEKTKEEKLEDDYLRNLQREKAQEYSRALKSPLIAKKPMDLNRQAKTDALPRQAGDTPSGKIDPAALLSKAGENGYDPAADRDKEDFSKRAERAQWLSPYTREAGNPFEVKTGTVIPGIMITGINSDLPGSMIAQVSQNVYDTATGYRLLIPQGSKLFGVYDSRVIYGQSRVLIAWNRVIFPDGSAVTLGAMPGADMSGYAGFTDQVNNHYLRIFGSAVLMSLITGGTSYAVDSVSNNSNSTAQTATVQDAMAASLASQLGQTTQMLLQRNLNIKPTLEIRPGYQFNVIVTKDVVFKGAYR